MARQSLIKNYNNMRGGIVTDPNELEPPENAVRDALNFSFEVDGTYKRKGLDLEAGSTVNAIATLTATSSEFTSRALNTFEWPSVAKRNNLDAMVAQAGSSFVASNKGVDAQLSDAPNLSGGGTRTFSQVTNYPTGSTGQPASVLQWAVIEGYAVGVAENIRPLAATYDDSVVPTYSSNVAMTLTDQQIRDFVGVDDGLANNDRVHVLVLVVDNRTGTFTAGEDITITNGTTITRRYRIIHIQDQSAGVGTFWIDKSLGATNTDFDGINDISLNNFSVTGVSSGATADVNGGPSGVGLSDAHRYNLVNQGWPQEHMDTYVDSTALWPSNAQIWFQGRDSNNDFDPDELDKIEFGTSRAPRGHVLLNALQRNRAAAVAGVHEDNVPTETLPYAFSACTEFGQRFAACTPDGTVFISQIVDKLPSNAASLAAALAPAFKFYQKNDPTSEIGNELLADDGIVIPLKGVQGAKVMTVLGHTILIGAENGWWAIVGADYSSGFKPTSFTTYQVTPIGVMSPISPVKAESALLYWAGSGVYAIQYPESGSLKLAASDITFGRVSKLYAAIPKIGKDLAKGYYDSHNNKVYWAYCNDSSADSGNVRQNILMYDAKLANWSKFSITTPDNTATDAGLTILGFTQDPAFTDSDAKVPIKLAVGLWENASPTNYFKVMIMEFNKDTLVDFEDVVDSISFSTSSSWSDDFADYEAYIEPWPDPLGDLARTKQSLFVYVYMKKTETGFEENDEGALEAINQSSLKMRSKWNWHNSAAGGRWGSQYEVYRHERAYIPEDAMDTYDSGESLVITRNKVFGSGYALALRFDAVARKNAILKGFAVPYTENVKP